MRFKGFEDEWKLRKLNDLADKVNSGKTPLGGEAVYSSNGIPFIRSQNVTNDQLKLENPVFIPEVVNAQMKNSVVKADDILLNITGASLGRSCVVPKDFEMGNVNQHVCIIRLNNQADPRFVQPVFSSDKGQSIFNSLQTGSGREGLNFESIKGIKLYIPECLEQKKIASFLALLNSRIQTQSKIIRELSVLKGILIKKLFLEKVRFKNEKGKDFQGWKDFTLGDIGDVKMCKRIFNEETSPLGEVPFFKIGSFGKEADAFISRSQYIDYKKRFSYPDKGDILISAAGTIGRIVIYKGEEAYYQDSNIVWINNDNTLISNSFLFYILQTVKYNTEGGTIQRLYNSILKLTKFRSPTLIEQNKISNFLSKIDSKIEVEKELLLKYENQKKYLLQNLFI